MTKFWLLVFTILYAFSLPAQKFRYGAALQAVDSSGFYKIQLAPELNAKLLDGYADFRLLDSAGKEIPYILDGDQAMTTTSLYKEYEIVEKKFLKDSATIVILRNDKNESIDNLSLQIRNADVYKTMNLSGSFDRKQWFVLKESESIYSVRNQNDVAEIKLFHFPLTNYPFLRLVINDKNSAPLDIIKAIHYESFSVAGSYTELKSRFVTSDSVKTKTTWVHVIFNEELIPDEFKVSVAAPVRYLRRVNIYYVNSQTKTGEKYFHSSVVLNSELSQRFSFGEGVRAKELWLEVINEDSPALSISGVSWFQLNRFCIAELEKGKQYQLRFGDSLLVSPRYDLTYFKDIIPSSMAVLKHGEIKRLLSSQQAPEPEKSIFTDKRYIWATLILIIALLGFVSFRMVAETK